MNNYFKNQIRRGNCAPTTRFRFFLCALVAPKRVWRLHANYIQSELDHQHEMYPYGGCLTYLEMYPHRCMPARRPVL